ncbi:MAG: phosphoglycerate kinase [Candidatus Moranbacteria bacterium]|jgi:phosphoglycerate kinase|nr:phosphoglycerate kinase [Candidatus Moranbacteria bacterium]MDD5651784.1 phosphoglycerate kinase [Candidatus Moranbacteria bacterium]MDX9855805.1 phosphoglycerate kinase [Candidatus Moranbacteria bacterium]
MELKKIQDANLKGKNVLVRVDFNVPLKKGGGIEETYKIRSAKATVDHILSKEGAVTLISHLGRPLEQHKDNLGSGIESMGEFSLKKIIPDARDILGVDIKLISSCDSNVIKKSRKESGDENRVFLLENIRFYKEEEENDENFSADLAENFDIFINEAFSVCHRAHASVVGVAKNLPSYAGFHLQREVENLERVKNYPEHPAVAIIGGAKIETKLPLIKSLSDNYDFILVGGKIANEAIDQGIKFDEKVILPFDFADADRFDIGPKTIDKFIEVIDQAETIVWNGPMGMFEKEPFDRGTRKILEAVIGSGAFAVVGGGESIQAIEQGGFMDKLSFVSTGGGAMLEFLSGEKMPGLEVLE